MQQIKIDLKNPSTDKVNVELQWNVKVLEPKRGFLSGIFRPHNRIDRQVVVHKARTGGSTVELIV